MAEVTVKSAEQKLTEKATEEYISKLKAIYGEDATAKIEIAGVKLSKLGHIAECMNAAVDNRIDTLEKIEHYIKKPFAGNGYTITEISE